MDNALLHDGLEYWRRRTPDKLAMVLDLEETLTYAQLGDWSDGIAARLQEMGLRPGGLAAISGVNSLEWVAGAFGILKAGGVIVPLNERFVAGEIAYQLEACPPQVVIADAPRAELIRGVAPAAPILQMEALEALRHAPAGWQAVRVDSDTLAEIIFTSGTTGKPKGVMISHGRLLSKYYEMRLQDGNFGGPETRHLMSVSLQSGLGTTWGYLFTTSNGGTMYFMRRFDPALALRILTEARVTVFPAFPVILEQISRQKGFAAADLSSIVSSHTGGARVPAEILAVWREKGVLLRQMYGLTEGGNYAFMASAEEARAGKQSCGAGLPFTKVRLLREDGTECAAGEAGEVVMRGPGMMVGYWRNEAATAAAVKEGWLHTGDLGRFDEDGNFHFVDRAKDMIITGGFNVSPSEVEAVIAQLPGVLEVAVFRVPDEKFGEAPAACVYAVPALVPETVFAHCKQHLAGFKLPRYVIAAEAPLPRMPSSKIDKRGLAAAYADAPERLQKLG